MRENGEHLKKVLELLRQHQLYVNGKKCCFKQSEVEYLGHIMSSSWVSADPKKVEVMVEWPVPHDIKSLRGCLGLIGYYRCFMKDYGKLVQALINLLKKDGFIWGKKLDLPLKD